MALDSHDYTCCQVIKGLLSRRIKLENLLLDKSKRLLQLADLHLQDTGSKEYDSMCWSQANMPSYLRAPRCTILRHSSARSAPAQYIWSLAGPDCWQAGCVRTP